MTARGKPWDVWADEIAIGVRSVSDETLQLAAHTLLNARLVLVAGNGGSAALASHAAQALMKPDYAAGGGAAAVCLTDGVPTLTAHANDGGWESALVEAARPFCQQSGVALLLISSSGKSRNIVRLAEEFGECRVVAFTGFSGGPLRAMANVSIHVDSYDYEVVEPVHDALLHRVQYHVRGIRSSTRRGI